LTDQPGEYYLTAGLPAARREFGRRRDAGSELAATNSHTVTTEAPDYNKFQILFFAGG